MHLLITGGAGFIGTSFLRLYADQYDKITILDYLSPQIHGQKIEYLDVYAYSNVNFIRDRVKNIAEHTYDLTDISSVLHLASETGTGQSMYDISKYSYVNDYETSVLLEYLLKSGCYENLTKFVLASSRAIYGEGMYVCNSCKTLSQPKPRCREDLIVGKFDHLCISCENILRPVASSPTAIPNPASLYAANKLHQEHMVRIWSDSYGIPYIITRLQNVYGRGQSLRNPYTGILSAFSLKAMNNLNLPVYEDGNETRDFVHVNDVAAALNLSIQSPAKNLTIDIGSGVPTTIKIAADLIVSAFDSSSNVEITGEFRIGDIRHNFASIVDAKNKIGFNPTIGFDEGISDFAAWVKSHVNVSDQLSSAVNNMKKYNLMG